jgi:membrane-associated phospholipid phosphatase
VRQGVRAPLLACLGCAAGLSVLLIVAYAVSPFPKFDALALNGFETLQGPFADDVLYPFARTADPLPLAAFLIVLSAVGLSAGRGRQVGAALVAVSGANITTQVLKVLLAHPRFHSVLAHQIGAAAFPSGHATAAMSIALALVIVSPRAWRPIAAAVGGLFALAVSFSIVTLGWHFPSDIVGGYLVATTWCLTLLAGLLAAEQRWPERGSLRDAARRAVAPREALKVVGILGAFGAAIASGIGLAKLDRVAQFADRHTTATVAAVTISLCAAGVVAGITMVTSRRQ